MYLSLVVAGAMGLERLDDELDGCFSPELQPGSVRERLLNLAVAGVSGGRAEAFHRRLRESRMRECPLLVAVVKVRPDFIDERLIHEQRRTALLLDEALGERVDFVNGIQYNVWNLLSGGRSGRYGTAGGGNVGAGVEHLCRVGGRGGGRWFRGEEGGWFECERGRRTADTPTNNVYRRNTDRVDF